VCGGRLFSARVGANSCDIPSAALLGRLARRVSLPRGPEGPSPSGAQRAADELGERPLGRPSRLAATR